MLRSLRRAGVLSTSGLCKSSPLGLLCSRLISGLGTTMPSPKHLDDILKLDSLTDKTPEDIEALWMEFHSDDFKGRAAMVVQADEYELLRERASSAPLFVLPLGKGQGRSLSMLLQWQMPHALFTGLDDYRAMGSAAQPHMTLTHYSELKESKGIVLVRGDVLSPHIVSTAEARTLMVLAHAFYTDPMNYQHVHNFNHDPDRFDYKEILQQLGHDLPPL